MKLTFRFLLLVATLLGAVGASELQGSRALDQLGQALQLVVDSDMERVFAVTHVRRLFRSMIVLEGDYLLAKTDVERKSMDKKMVSLANEQLQQIEKYQKLMPAEDARAAQDIRSVRSRWIELDKQVRNLAGSKHDEAVALSKLHDRDPVNWETVIGSLVKLSEMRLTEQVARTKVVQVRAKKMLALVGLFAIFVAAGLGLVIFLGIRRNINQVIALNMNLEKLVLVRTEALTQRERSLRLVLDSTGDAFIELDREGFVSGECSAAALRWFGEPRAGMPGSRYLFEGDEERQMKFEMAYSQLIDDILPWELTVDQMPCRTEVRSVILDFEYKKVHKNNEFSSVLVVARDVTARVHSELAETNAREQQNLIGKLLADKAGFAQFVKDCEGLIADLTSETDLAAIRRYIHTLKGNAAVFGLSSVSDYCHTLEDEMADSCESPDSAKVADLASLWRTKMQGIEQFLSSVSQNVLEVESEEHQKLIDSLLQRRDYEEILSMVEVWSWCRTAERLARLRAQTEYIARRLDKDVNVVVEHNDIRIPNDYLSNFWPVLIHVLRNAVDHGVDTPGERTAQGKCPKATLKLCTHNNGDQFVVEVSDDGPGIDRNAIWACAAKRDIPVAADATLEQLLWTDGVSSRTEVSDISGRGIGLSAVRQACELEGGTARIVDVPGRGASFQFSFRRPVVKPGALAAKLEKRWSLLPHGRGKASGIDSQTLRRGPDVKISKA